MRKNLLFLTLALCNLHAAQEKKKAAEPAAAAAQSLPKAAAEVCLSPRSAQRSFPHAVSMLRMMQNTDFAMTVFNRLGEPHGTSTLHPNFAQGFSRRLLASQLKALEPLAQAVDQEMFEESDVLVHLDGLMTLRAIDSQGQPTGAVAKSSASVPAAAAAAASSK